MLKPWYPSSVLGRLRLLQHQYSSAALILLPLLALLLISRSYSMSMDNSSLEKQIPFSPEQLSPLLEHITKEQPVSVTHGSQFSDIEPDLENSQSIEDSLKLSVHDTVEQEQSAQLNEDEEEPAVAKNVDTAPASVTESKPVQAVSGVEAPSAARTVSAADTGSQNAECRRYIIYDKPVKTGSTAVTKALRSYFSSRGDSYSPCILQACTDAAEAMCAGTMARNNIVGHQVGRHGLLNCLGGKGFYRVTSVRAPKERWESSYLYNLKKNRTHFGIGVNESYGEFMRKHPSCALHGYYDGLSKHCEDSELSPNERADRIVERYDEIIDLYNDGREGPLQGRLRNLLRSENKSPRPATFKREAFNEWRLEPEMYLYKVLKRRQAELAQQQRYPKLCL